MAPPTRRQRKAAAAAATASSSSAEPEITIQEIPLAVPDRSRPKGQTLIDLIDEKRPRDARGVPIGAKRIRPVKGGEVAEAEELEEGEGEEEEGEQVGAENVFGPGMNTVFYTVPLMILLFGMDVLVHMQYRQEVDHEWSGIWWRTMKAGPAIFAIHYIVHPRKDWLITRLGLFGLSIAAGCYIVKAVNVFGYYWVMRKTPPLATLWIWAAIELDLSFAVLSCVAVGAYTWWHEYAIL